jgi:hypothetical protein
MVLRQSFERIVGHWEVEFRLARDPEAAENG